MPIAIRIDIAQLVEEVGKLLAFCGHGGFGWGFAAAFSARRIVGRLITSARDGCSETSRLTRRANALVLLDDGWSCQEVAAAFLLNNEHDPRTGAKLFERRGVEGLTSFDVGGSVSFLSAIKRP